MVSPFLKVAVERDDLERTDDARKSSSTRISWLPHFRPLGARPLNCSTLGQRRSFTLVAWDALIAELRDSRQSAVFPGETARQHVRTAGRRPSELFFFCQDLSSGPDPPGFAPDFARNYALDHKNGDLLAWAEASHAEFLVTGDRKLRSLKHHKSSRIIAAAMIEILKAHGEQII